MQKHTCHLDHHQRSHYVTIGLKNWVRKLFNNQKEKLLDNQKEKLFDKPSFSNQSNQLRSGQLGITQDVIVVQTCSSEDNKSLNVDQTHDRSGQPDKHTIAIQDDPEVCHEAKTLNTDNETIRDRIEADMEFKIPALPHSVVKHAQSASVR